MSGVRQAALVLHGLAPADREWMLSRLPDDRADDLRVLLQELQEIGIPAEPALIRSAIEPRTGGDDRRGLRGIAEAGADEIYSILCNEPDPLIATVMSSSAWPWAEGLLARLGPARAQRIRSLAQEQAVGAALRGAVLRHLSSRVPQGRPSARAANPALARLKQWWSAWTR